MDPHKRSATIEIINEREKSSGRAGSAPTATATRRCSPPAAGTHERVWAVEGCNGIGRHVAQRLVADGETVLDVPAKLSARARVFATGQGRKTDPVDAHSVAVVALRTNGLRQVTSTTPPSRCGCWSTAATELGRARTETLNRLHQLLLELVPGGAKKFLSAPQARALLTTVRPRDLVGRTRRRLASELITSSP